MYLLYTILGFLFVGAIVFGVYYHFASNKDNFSEWKNMELTKGARVLWLCNLIVMFVGIWVFVYGLIESDALGALGGIAWILTAMAAAQFCSPLKPVAMPEGDGKNGCLFLLTSPLLLITSVVSGIISMLIAWVFNLITILRKSSVVFKFVVCLLVAAVVIVPPTVVVGMDIAEKNRMEAAEKTENELVDSMVAEIKSAIDSDSVEKISFTDEQLAYCTDNGLPSPFSLMKVEEMIAYKMSDLYNKKNFDGILRVTDLYNANEGVFTGYYTYEFIDFMTEYVEANGKFDSYTSSGSKVYSYGEYSITVSKSAITVKTYDDDLGDSFFEFDVNEKVYTEMWVAGETVEHITKD